MTQTLRVESGRAPDLFRMAVVVFLGLRLTLLMVLPIETPFAYGDFGHHYNLAVWSVPGQCLVGPAACWPLLDYWNEYPPVFPYLSIMLVKLLGGGGAPPFHVYAYGLALVLLLVDLGNLLLVRRIALRLYHPATADWATVAYALLPAPLILSWWTFDGLTTFWMLLGLWALLERRDGVSALAVGLGVLTKLVPVLLLPAIWRALPTRRAAAVTAGSAAIVAVVLAPFLIRSPAMATASLLSQFSKSSYATVWAILDGNHQTAEGQPITGNFGALGDRFDPARATMRLHQPGRVPGWLTVLTAAGVYRVVWWRTRRRAFTWNEHKSVLLVAFTWTIFLLWSKGWSPQWQHMLAPLILLTFPNRTGVLFALLLSAVSFLEWPLLLSRGLAWGYWLTIPLRTLLIFGWAVALARCLLGPSPVPRAELAA
jgi:hypothetical protein